MIHIKTAKKTLEIYWPDFSEIDGAIFLTRELPKRGINLTIFHDLTEAEAFYNHIHLLDLFSHRARIEGDEDDFWDRNHPDFQMACSIGKDIIKMWAHKLKAEFRHKEFRLYFTSDFDPTVRFHTVHENEPEWLSESNWGEQISDGRIVIIDTSQNYSPGIR
ncbi:MAG TPA: hypothetical protein VEF04_14335 [Blastocatellia bacterium]|nr:hypothetical protein [Blastocatellia bacterium]